MTFDNILVLLLTGSAVVSLVYLELRSRRNPAPSPTPEAASEPPPAEKTPPIRSRRRKR